MLIEQVKALLEKFKQDVIEQYGGMNEGLRQDFAKLDARIKELEGIVTPRKVSLPGVDL